MPEPHLHPRRRMPRAGLMVKHWLRILSGISAPNSWNPSSPKLNTMRSSLASSNIACDLISAATASFNLQARIARRGLSESAVPGCGAVRPVCSARATEE